MTRKHDLPPDRDRPPAMFVGDEMPEPRLPAQTQEAAAVPPDDLRVVIERTSAGRLALIAVGLLAALALGVAVMEWMYPDPHTALWLTNYAFLAGGIGALAWLANRDLVRRRREFRLLDDGIAVAVQPLTAGPPRTAHVPWTEIADYTFSVDPEKAFLQVVSVRGYTLTLKDRPPRLSTREFIRRFVEQADRHPRAVEAEPRAEGSRLPDATGERAPALGGCATVLGVVLVTSAVETFLDPSFAQEAAAIIGVGLIFMTVTFFLDLDDPEAAGSDATSIRLIARLRRWLRRVLGIRAT